MRSTVPSGGRKSRISVNENHLRLNDMPPFGQTKICFRVTQTGICGRRGFLTLMKKNMFSVTLISFVGLLVSAAVYHFAGNRGAFSAAVTFGTILYHFAMRLAVGYLIDARYHNHMDYTRKWFQEKAFERKLYDKIKVKKWKKRLPTFTPQYFNLKSRSPSEIVQATCQAEVVHEVIMLLSFVPVIFSVWFGSLGVFLITSCISFLFDGVFVIIQRYNRPRLIRILKK